MPTFTAISLDRLLEPASRSAIIPKPLPVKPLPRPLDARPLPLPALYATPLATPLPDSPSSFPPSPYIVNHKRRGPRLQKPEQVLDSNTDDAKDVDIDGNLEIETTMNYIEENSSGSGIARDGDASILNSNEVERDGESEDFFEFLDSMSSASNAEGEDMQRSATPIEEYYSAYDDISIDGGSRSPFKKTDDEIREMRLNLLIEIEKRKQAEEAVENIQRKWKNLCQNLSCIGLVLPNISISLEEEEKFDPIEDLSQQIIVARTVATSVARGFARAEAEMEIEPQIVAKNFEIARLLDRLHYYEAANREMSQRNQEAVEKARQRRHRRNRRMKWLWGSISLAVTLSSAAIAWSYLPSSKTLSSQEDFKDDH